MTSRVWIMHRVALFIVACLLAGLGGLLGSVVGHAAGPRALIAGGIAGGLLGAVGSIFVARSRGWIQAPQVRLAAVGASIGFLAAATIATHTLGSPVGPILSTALVGLGAVLGVSQHRDHVK